MVMTRFARHGGADALVVDYGFAGFASKTVKLFRAKPENSKITSREARKL